MRSVETKQHVEHEREAATPQALPTAALDYELPERLIATRPAEPRDSARMLVMRRSSDRIEHRHVRDLPEFLQSGDALVFNNTSVIPARLIGRRADTGGRVEGLFLEESQNENGGIKWRVMLKAGGRLRPGMRIELVNSHEQPSGFGVTLLRLEDSEWIVSPDHGRSAGEVMQATGWTPLPPYILKARGDELIDDEADRSWYQTVYADRGQGHSVAAPTAGLHFTPELLQKLNANGVDRIDVTLHVGPGTFKPITAETIDQHRMHTESYEISSHSLVQLNDWFRSRLQLREVPSPRLIAIGTTSVRTLESLPADWPQFCGPIRGMTDLKIVPPYEFRLVDGMLTNFHLPRSTLLALVAAMVGLDRLKSVYREAIERGYRFYSYGDAMLILP